MKKLEFALRGVIWLIWNFFYVLLAGWVGQEEFARGEIRFLAALVWLFWLIIGAALIESTELPQALTKALTEDEA